MSETFRALMVDQQEGETTATVQNLGLDALPEGDVLLSVAYSSLNYKDGLAITGKAKVLRRYPMVPGVDMAGTVLESDSPGFKVGDQVLLTGFDHGAKYWGGFTERNRVSSAGMIHLPPGLTLRQSMAIGTAGLTAMLSVMALEAHGLTAEDQREVVVTGAAGGVGSTAVAILAGLGYNVVASTGRESTHDYLRRLGAKSFIGRDVLSAPSQRPLQSERWAAAVDAVGGDTLAGLLRSMVRGGSIALSGNAGGVFFSSSVLPFILRGINLLGIDSNLGPVSLRRTAWERLAKDIPLDQLDLMTEEAELEDLPTLGREIVKGNVRGRTVIRVAGD
jgi:acrylyl-CoA reductase (NADPH)